jgi:RHS repeat-associated protein
VAKWVGNEVSEEYLYDPAGNQTSAHQPGVVDTLLRSELYVGGGRHAATWNPSAQYGPLIFNHTDWLGTERVRTDSTGTARESCSDTPYEMNTVCNGTGGDTSPMHFTGKQRDHESGLDNFGARYFGGGNSLGRFMSPDPIIVTPTRMADPQRFNLYAYARNAPLQFVDPTGKDIDFTNDTEDGRKKALGEITQNLSAKEAANIGIRTNKDGESEAYVIDKGAIGKGSSTQYKQLVNLINDHSIVAEVGLVGGGLSATFQHGAFAEFGSISSYSGQDSVFAPNPGSRYVDVLATQGNLPGGTQVCCDGKGHAYQGAQPGFITMWHELMGETMKYRAGYEMLLRNRQFDSDAVIAIENYSRAAQGMPPRTGADHGPVITVNGKVQ